VSCDRPEMPAYFMGIALAVRARANCRGSRVGAVIARDDRIVSTGYNGTPSGMTNCLEGGCLRCAHPERYAPGEAYDLCICVHAEQNALLAAARFGIGVEGAALYTTMQPCFGCAKELLQARVAEIRYLHPWEPGDPAKRAEYLKLIAAFDGRVRHLPLPDPDEAWAVSRTRAPAAGDAGGHQLQ
jgi:dCMP deaminase